MGSPPPHVSIAPTLPRPETPAGYVELNRGVGRSGRMGVARGLVAHGDGLKIISEEVMSQQWWSREVSGAGAALYQGQTLNQKPRVRRAGTGG